MRKNVRVQILGLFPDILDGIKYAQTANKESALGVLENCCAALKSIGNALKDGLSESRFLTYNKTINQLFLLLTEMKLSLSVSKNKQHIAAEIQKTMNQIITELQQEKEVELEILFLPYKASMWDSLESIWFAAKEDERCNCYVMPIPYFDRNPDQSFGTMHYEGRLFPVDVPITHYTEYDISQRRPDAIYIHNPYDERNYVTSVDPKYYSHELKKYTDMLVYVPYFVVMEDIGLHLCKVSAAYYADKVIVQSEKIKKKYMENYPDGNPPPDKFLALGSPKIDKVLKENGKKQELPTEWEKMIGNKKIILYNTHLSHLLMTPDVFLKKLRYVFSCFKNRDDVILWWRPHPLSEASLQTLIPEVLQQYVQVEKEYKESHIGIFDDTADLHRAIAASDAYYGDMSSLVPMYGVTGKPIMMQAINFTALDDEYICSLCFDDMAVDGDTIWFIAREINGLFKMDLKTDRVEFLGAIPGEKINGRRKYIAIEKIDNKIIIVPFEGNKLIIYDIKSKCFDVVELDLPKNFYKCDEYFINKNFISAIRYKSYIFMIGVSIPLIIRYDTVNNKCKYYTQWFNKIKKYAVNMNLPPFWKNYSIRENVILMPFCQNNIVMGFNMDNGKVDLHFIGKKGNCYIDIAYDGKDYWLIQNKPGAIVKWNYENGQTKEYIGYPVGCTIHNSEDRFINIVSMGKYMLLFPVLASMVVKIDTETGEMIEVTEMEMFHEKQYISKVYRAGAWYIFAKNSDDGRIFALASSKNILIEVDVKNGGIKKHKVVISNNIRKKIIINMDEGKKIIYEGEGNLIDSISWFLYFLSKHGDAISQQRIEFFKEFFSIIDEPSGNRIHKQTIKEF
jgi:hypothetical protein